MSTSNSLDEFMSFIQYHAYKFNESYDTWKDNPELKKFINNDFYKKMKLINNYTDDRTAQCFYLSFVVFMWRLLSGKTFDFK